jgi:hypothetical protein
MTPSLPGEDDPPGRDDPLHGVGPRLQGRRPAGSNFDYASGLAEVALLSNLAIRARRPIEWDGPR